MVDGLLESLGVAASAFKDGNHPVHTPIDGSQIASVSLESKAQVVDKIALGHEAFLAWRTVPAPRRASWCACSVKSCAPTRLSLASWCRSKPARSLRKAWVKCRK